MKLWIFDQKMIEVAIRISWKKLTEPNGSKQSLTHALKRPGISRPDHFRKINGPSVWTSPEQTIDDNVWRVCMDTKMSNFQRYYWSAVYLIGFALPLIAVLISYSGLFRFIRETGFNTDFHDGQWIHAAGSLPN